MNAIMTIINLIPALIAAIKAIEEAIPGQGAGEAKLAAVRSILEAIDSNTKAMWPTLQLVIGHLVQLLNSTAWKK